MDALREIAFMPADERKIAERLITDFDKSNSYGHDMDVDYNIQYINWDIDAIFDAVQEPQISPKKRKQLDYLMSNLQQSKDGIARVEAANDLVKMGKVAVHALVKALKDTPRPHDVATTLGRIDPIYGRRAKEWLAQNKRR